MSFNSSVNNGKVQSEPAYKKDFGVANNIPVYDVNGFFVDSGIPVTGFSGGTSGTTTASNGLTKVGNNIKLGGNLNESVTLISITGSSAFQIANSDDTKGRLFLDNAAGFAGDYILLGQEVFTNRRANVKLQRNTIDIGDTITGSTLISLDGDASTISFSGVQIFGLASSQLVLLSNQIYLNSATSGSSIANTNGNIILATTSYNLSFTEGVGTIFTDNTTGTTGIQYSGDYSPYFKKHSLVDVNYVTGLTSGSSSVSAGNGLHKVGSLIQLGGVTTGDTNIGTDNGAFNVTGATDNASFNVTLTNTGGTTQSGIQSNNSFIQFISEDVNTIFRLSEIRAESSQAGLANQNLNTGEIVAINVSVDGFKINDTRFSTGQTGIQYAANYSANFVDRSLVDKGWVLSQISGGTGSGSTTASNGLTKIGSDIQLGGTLVGDTVIDAGSSQFKIDASSGTGNSFEMASWGGFLMNTQQQFIISAELPSASQGFFVGVRDGDAGSDFSNQIIIKSPSGNSTSTSGDGVNAVVITPTSINNDIRTALTLVRSSFTSPYTMAPGFGVKLDFFVDQNNAKKSNISYSLTDVTNGFEQGKFGFSLHKSGNITNILNVDGHGAKYAGDYSSGFTKYSLVDVNYVTGSTTTNAGNGLTKIGNVIKLGGILTGDTTIDLTGKTLTIGGTAAGKTNQLNISNGGGFSLTSTGAASSEINLYTANGGTHSQIDIVPAQVTIDTPKIELAGTSLTIPTSNSIATKSYVLGTKTFTGSQTLRTGSATAGTFPLQFVSGALLTVPVAGVEEFLTDKKYFTITTGAARKEYTFNDIALTSSRVPFATTNGRLTDSSGLTFTVGTGLKYGGNYSANYTARSLVDKAFVTGLTSSLPSQNVYGTKVVITASTTLNSTNFVVFCNTSVSGFTVTLPSSPVDGQVYKIKDTSSALTNNITINGNGKNIDGSSTALINTNFGGIEVCYDSSLNAWFIMNFIG